MNGNMAILAITWHLLRWAARAGADILVKSLLCRGLVRIENFRIIYFENGSPYYMFITTSHLTLSCYDWQSWLMRPYTSATCASRLIDVARRTLIKKRLNPTWKLKDVESIAPDHHFTMSHVLKLYIMIIAVVLTTPIPNNTNTMINDVDGD